MAWGLFLFLFAIDVPVAPASAAAESQDFPLEQLAQHPQWLRLLHFDAAGQAGTFLSEDFYLSRSGQYDPSAELRATLDALNIVIEDETHPRCRFPARYFWLAGYLQNPELRVVPPACQGLRQWLEQYPLKSISLLMVSGYMGNPASIFGHAFLKLNSVNDDHDLFSSTINYGALVPPDEPAIEYIFKGLFGGYQAGYSDRYFYTQDMVYTNTEARDIWEYELELAPEKARLLQLHVWEILGKKKQYYFLNRNCAYELARVMDVVLEPRLSHRARIWYVPVEMFNRLRDLDQAQRVSQGDALIRDVRYHPSAERMLIHHYDGLDTGLRRRAREFLHDPEIDRIDGVLSGLNPERQRKLLDFLFSYQHFRYTKELPEPDPETVSLKHALLVKRLSRPPSPGSGTMPEYRPSPAEGQKPVIIGFGAMQQENGEAAPAISVAAYAQEPTGWNPLDGGELTVLDLRLALSNEEPLVRRVDYLRIFNHASSHLPVTSPWSWRLQLRSIRVPDEKYDHQVYFGLGRSGQFGRALLYGLLTPSLHSLSPILRLRPEAGLVFPVQDMLRIRLGIGMENTADGWREIATGAVQYSPTREISMVLEYQRDPYTMWQVTLRSHW